DTDASDTSLTVRLYSSDGALIAESMPVLLFRQHRLRVDIRLPRRADGPSEFALIDERVAEGLNSGAPGLDGAEEAVVRQVSDWLDVDAERLGLYQQARAFGAGTDIPAPVYYALGRTGTGPALDDLLDVSLDELRTTLDEAAADGIIDRAALDNDDTLIERLAGQIVDHAMSRTDGDLRPGLREILAAADIPPDAIARVLRRYHAPRGTAADFWDAFPTAEGASEDLGGTDANDVAMAVRLSVLVGADPPLLRRLYAMRRDGRWTTPPDLAALDFD